MTAKQHLRVRRIAAVAMAIGLFAAACGGDSSSDDTASDDATTTTADGSTDTTEAMEDGETGSIVDNVAIGTSGFTIDLNECPEDWANDEGVTDTEIKLGHSFIFSGPAAGYGAISDGMSAYFEARSTESPEDFGGRTVRLVAKDDGYEAARTVSNVQELVEVEGIFAAASMAGTPNNLAVYDYLNDQCVPHLFAATGHPAWGDPENHPWTTPSFLSYSTEGDLWVQLIVEMQDAGDLPNPATAATLTMNNDFGLAIINSFKASAEATGGRIEVVQEQLHDPAAPNLTNEITTLGGSDADVIAVASGAVYCTQSMTGVAESSWDPALMLIANVCTGAGWFEPAGAAGEGWIMASGLKDIRSTQYDDDDFVLEGREIFDAAGVDWQQNANAGSGLLYAPPTLEALEQANQLPGGITRTNLVIGARMLDFQHPYYAEGIRWHMDGAVDNYPIEAALFVEHKMNEAVGYAEPEAIGEVIDKDGETPICAWDGQNC